MTKPPHSLPHHTKDVIAKMPPFIGLDLEHVHLVATPQEAAFALEDLLGSQVLGFDTESRPTFRKGELSEGPHILQFATLSDAYIFQTCNVHGRTAVATILRSKHIAKIGFGLDDDIKRIKNKLQLQPHAIIDLNNIFRLNFGQKNSVGVKTAIALLFNRRFTKSHKATTSNWSNKVLSEQQLLYAANDAFGAMVVYAELRKRGIEVG